MKIYLAGPMRGIPEFNFPAFHCAAKKLRSEGYEVFNPAEKSEEHERPGNTAIDDSLDFRRRVFGIDMAWICEHASCVALLPGWEKSMGARAEKALAHAIGLTVVFLGPEDAR